MEAAQPLAAVKSALGALVEAGGQALAQGREIQRLRPHGRGLASRLAARVLDCRAGVSEPLEWPLDQGEVRRGDWRGAGCPHAAVSPPDS